MANNIFHNCIRGILKDKGVILVTHQLQFMPLVDKILYLDKGKQGFYGSYEELQQNDIIDIKAILETKEKKVEPEGITLKEDRKS